ncbi:MAG: TetR family transcriptional regulator [Alphaproteobacteria bacterium]|nr:TetR family transcriptional regulator [Alphaproteobacteria bacterium]
MGQATTKPLSARDARREAILDVARDVFLEEGYAAASMSTIAARVGGSKATLYNYFRSKEELFEAYVRRHCAWQQGEIFALAADEEDIGTALTRLGKSYLRMVMSDYNLRHFRMITAEAERSPEIGQAFYQSGPESGAALLAGFLEDARKAGHLKLDDPLRAAHQFTALCQNRLLKARLCAAAGEPTEDEITAEVASAVRLFMAAYAPR